MLGFETVIGDGNVEVGHKGSLTSRKREGARGAVTATGHCPVPVKSAVLHPVREVSGIAAGISASSSLSLKKSLGSQALL
jgi:hypothetical protein